MPWAWEDFLVLAKKLAEAPATEAAYRSSVSRAYYAAYHVAKITLEASGLTIPRGAGSHKRVWDAYSFSSADRARAVGIALPLLLDPDACAS